MTPNELTCPICGLRFVAGTLTGKRRADAHFANGCDAPIPEPPVAIAMSKLPPKSQVVKHPGRRGKGGKGY
ncbi:hypothetical protein [Zavarzinella formosa]|uniref:hypothetical protein n=1 Tax=Zavarzinella formosa TaxID=360055 RepID=UPI00035F3248|nr:hypothetical protein [Zavarzinella formosa]